MNTRSYNNLYDIRLNIFCTVVYKLLIIQIKLYSVSTVQQHYICMHEPVQQQTPMLPRHSLGYDQKLIIYSLHGINYVLIPILCLLDNFFFVKNNIVIS